MSEYICPNCKNPIYDEDALLCHFCGGSLRRGGKGLLSKVRYPESKILWYVVVFLVLAGFVMMFVF